MSLQFVMGPSGAGKSHYLYDWVTKEAWKHPEKNYIVIVPEQFTMQTQKDLVMANPRKGILNVEVLSFHRLAQRVLEETGENHRVILNDVGKNFVIRKIAGDHEEELKVLGAQLKKIGYISQVKSILSELTQYNIGKEEMEQMIAGLEGFPRLCYKLQDIQLIYEKFQEFLKEKYITSEEVLDVLSGVAHKSKLLKGSILVLDGFTGFTPVQNKLMRELFSICEEVKVAVTMDKRENPFVYAHPYQLFGISKQMVTSLVKIGEETRTPLQDPVYLYETPVYRFKGNEALDFLESHLFRYSEEQFEKEQDRVQVWCAKNPQQEAEFVAGQIRRLVRTEGYRYRDIAVLTNDMTAYDNYIERVFEKYDIPVFMDHKRSILLNACVEYVRSLLSMVEKDFSYESVFRYLRTGLTNISRDDVDFLETYVIALGIRGYKKWQEKWIRRTRGMEETDLERLNQIRMTFLESVVEVTEVLKERKKTVREVTVALLDFMMKQELQKQAKEYQEQFENGGELALAKEYAQVYRILIELLNQFVELLGGERISLREYCELLDAGLEQAKVGVIPPSVDQVLVGDVERSRIKDVKAVFLIGASENIIPGDMTGGGLLSEFDRQKMVDKGMQLAPGVKEKTYIQKFYLYMMLTKPTEQLYLSYSKADSSGKGTRPSYLVTEILQLYKNLKTRLVSEEISENELSVRQGLRFLVSGLQNEHSGMTREWQELYTWYKKNPEWKEKIKELVDATYCEIEEHSITRESAKLLYGEVLENSISRLEKYSACAYAHFLTYGLRLREREEYQFQAMDLGTLFHGAIEKFSRKLEKIAYTWTTIPEELSNQLVEESVDECIVDYGNSILYSSSRNAYIIIRLKRMLRRTVWALKNQIAESGGYVPREYEVSFYDREVDLGVQGKMRLQGKIDRVDIQEDEETVRVRIVDYKTGKHAFDLGEVCHGLQMQLIVYMNAAMDMQKQLHPDKKVEAGGLYYYQMQDPIVDESEVKTTIDETILKKLDMNGVAIGEKLSEEQFQIVSSYANAKIRQIGKEILDGKAEVAPYKLEKETGCQYCPYRTVCGFDERMEGYEYRKLPKLKGDDALAKMNEEVQSWE